MLFSCAGKPFIQERVEKTASMLPLKRKEAFTRAILVNFNQNKTEL